MIPFSYSGKLKDKPSWTASLYLVICLSVLTQLFPELSFAQGQDQASEASLSEEEIDESSLLLFDSAVQNGGDSEKDAPVCQQMTEEQSIEKRAAETRMTERLAPLCLVSCYGPHVIAGCLMDVASIPCNLCCACAAFLDDAQLTTEQHLIRDLWTCPSLPYVSDERFTQGRDELAYCCFCYHTRVACSWPRSAAEGAVASLIPSSERTVEQHRALSQMLSQFYRTHGFLCRGGVEALSLSREAFQSCRNYCGQCQSDVSLLRGRRP